MISEKEKPWWYESMYFFGIVSAWIATPIIGALFLGRYLDKKFASAPWAFLSLTALAFVISIVGIVREVKKYLKRIEKESSEKNNGDN